MFGRKPRDLSILIHCLCGDSNSAPALIAGALEVVELSPTLRAAPLCWVLSRRALERAQDDPLPQIARRVENFGDSLATAGYRGFPNGALLAAELLKELDPAPLTGPPEQRLLFPREPDGRTVSVAEDRKRPRFIATAGGGSEHFARFALGTGTVDLPMVVVPSGAGSRQPVDSRRNRRRTLRTLFPPTSSPTHPTLIVVELLLQDDLAALRWVGELISELGKGASIRSLPDLLKRDSGAIGNGHREPTYRGRRSLFDQRALLLAAECRSGAGLRSQGTAVDAKVLLSRLDDSYRSILHHRDSVQNGYPLRRELAVPMTGQAILDEGGLSAVFDSGHLARLSQDQVELLGAGGVTSWMVLDGDYVEFKMADAISFQSDDSRGLRTSFLTRQKSRFESGLLVDAFVVDGRQALYLEGYLSFSKPHPSAYLDQLVPLSIPVAAAPVSVTCHYPDGEEYRLDIDPRESSKRVGGFGSRFTVESRGRSLTFAYLHPSGQYVGEVILSVRQKGNAQVVCLHLGPLVRGVPAKSLTGVCTRFVVGISADPAELTHREWPSVLGAPGIWRSSGDSEMED